MSAQTDDCYYASFPGIYIHTWEEVVCVERGPNFTESVFVTTAVCKLKIKNEFKKTYFLHLSLWVL